MSKTAQMFFFAMSLVIRTYQLRLYRENSSALKIKHELSGERFLDP